MIRITEQTLSQTEVLEFESIRAWEITICTCCANSYLFQVSSKEYVFVESWSFTSFVDVPNSFPRRNIRVERLPVSGKIVAIDISGDFFAAEERQLELTDLPNYGDSECEMFRADQFSAELRSKLRF